VEQRSLPALLSRENRVNAASLPIQEARLPISTGAVENFC
jgi:hypothetical protein